MSKVRIYCAECDDDYLEFCVTNGGETASIAVLDSNNTSLIDLNKESALKLRDLLNKFLNEPSPTLKELEGRVKQLEDRQVTAWKYDPNVFKVHDNIVTRDQPCMFDGLQPGVYGLVCHCPKCSIKSGGVSNEKL